MSENEQPESTADAVKKKCERCGKKFKELNYCVHCAISVCANCRRDHCEDLIDEYEKARNKAYSLKRKVNKKIKEVQENLDEQTMIYNKSESRILAAFAELEQDLRERRRSILAELRKKRYYEALPLENDKRELDKQLGAITRRFEQTCNVSVNALRTELGSGFKNVDHAKFAHLCACNYKAKESLDQFEQLASQSEKVNKPKMVKFNDDDTGSMKESISNYGRVDIEAKSSEGKSDDAKKDSAKEKENEEKPSETKEKEKDQKPSDSKQKQEEKREPINDTKKEQEDVKSEKQASRTNSVASIKDQQKNAELEE